MLCLWYWLEITSLAAFTANRQLSLPQAEILVHSAAEKFIVVGIRCRQNRPPASTNHLLDSGIRLYSAKRMFGEGLRCRRAEASENKVQLLSPGSRHCWTKKHHRVSPSAIVKRPRR
jgi:hypothetical protein